MDVDAHPLVLLIGQFATQTVVYFAAVGLAFAVVWKWGAQRFAARRIQKVRRVDSAQLRHEVKHTLVTLLVGTLSAGAVVLLTSAGYTKLSLDGEGWSPASTLGIIAALIAFNDLWFYAWHRLLHRPALFKRVHAVHHRSVDTNPFTSYSFHALEALVLGGWIVPMAVLVPLPVPALAATAVIGTANNVMSHLGYEFLPRWLLKVPGLRWMNTATFHSLHHAKSHGNYGLFTRVWDRLFGTELAGYEERFARRGEAGDGT